MRHFEICKAENVNDILNRKLTETPEDKNNDNNIFDDMIVQRKTANVRDLGNSLKYNYIKLQYKYITNLNKHPHILDDLDQKMTMEVKIYADQSFKTNIKQNHKLLNIKIISISISKYIISLRYIYLDS